MYDDWNGGLYDAPDEGFRERYPVATRTTRKRPPTVEPKSRARTVKPRVPEYWMICREDSRPSFTSPNPKKLYESEDQARHDAEMLAIGERKRFYLLKVVAVVGPTTPEVAWIESNE